MAKRKKTPIKSTPDAHSKHLSMRILRRLFHNTQQWKARGFTGADSLKAFAKVNAKRLRKGIDTTSPKVESLLT